MRTTRVAALCASELAAGRLSGGWQPIERRETLIRYVQDALATDRRHHRAFRHPNPVGCCGSTLAERGLSEAGLAGLSNADVHRDAAAITIRLAIAIAERKREAIAATEREPAQVADAVAESDDLAIRKGGRG